MRELAAPSGGPAGRVVLEHGVVELRADDDGHRDEVVEQQERDRGGERPVGQSVGVDVRQVQPQAGAGDQEDRGGQERARQPAVQACLCLGATLYSVDSIRIRPKAMPGK